MWSQIIPIAELALTALGLLFVFLEFRKSNHVKKSEFVKSLLQELKEDPEISKEVYSMQYFTFHYSGSFHDSTEEMAVDKALQFLSYICYLSEEGIISKKEFSFFEFDISQTLRSRDLINYMYNLYHFEKKSVI